MQNNNDAKQANHNVKIATISLGDNSHLVFL